MPNLSTLSRGTQLLVGAGVLLLIDTFLNWWSVDLGPISAGQNAWSGFWGVIMGLALLALLALVIARVFDVKLPTELPEGQIIVGLGALIFVFALLKNLIDDYSTIWSYIGVLLAAGVAYGAWLRYQEPASASAAAPSEPIAPTPPPPATPSDDDEAPGTAGPGST
jgi:drug/metabolite transporter (DMT)-like permease